VYKTFFSQLQTRAHTENKHFYTIKNQDDKNNIKHLYNEFRFLRKTLKMKIQMRSDIPTSENTG